MNNADLGNILKNFAVIDNTSNGEKKAIEGINTPPIASK